MIRRLLRHRRYPLVTREALRTYPIEDLTRRLEWPHRPPSRWALFWAWVWGRLPEHNSATCARCLVVDEISRRRGSWA